MIQVELELALNRGQTYPTYHTNLNNHKKLVITQSHNTKIVLHTGLVKDYFYLNYLDKTQNETVVIENQIVCDQSIAVQRMLVDGILIPTVHLKTIGSFQPEYRKDFIEHCQKNNLTLDTGPLNIIEFWHNGQWTIDFSNFWPRYSLIRNKDNTDFTGNSSQEIAQSLLKLKKLL